MQCPPTKPGEYLWKFHFVDAALITSFVSIFNLEQIIDNSLAKAIFKSLWVFSITFAASATIIDGAVTTFASMIFP